MGVQNIENDTLLAPQSEGHPQKGFQNETLQRQIMGKTFRHFYHMPNLINIEGPPEMENPKSPRVHSLTDGDPPAYRNSRFE